MKGGVDGTEERLLSSREDVKQLCGTIMRGSETSKEMDYTKASDQQWNGVLPDSFDVRTAWPQRASVLGHIWARASAVRDGHLIAPKPSKTGAASVWATPH